MKKILLLIFILGTLAACMSLEELQTDVPTPEKHLYIDVHHLGAGNVNLEEVAKAHARDLVTEEKYGVNFLRYWVDIKSGTIYCLSESPDMQQIISSHNEAHGMIPQEVHEVTPGLPAMMVGNSKLFLDICNYGTGRTDSLAEAITHQLIMKNEGRYRVNFINYWLDKNDGIVYSLSEAADSNAIVQTYALADKQLPDRVFEVIQGQ